MLQTSGMTRRACSCSMANTQGGSLVPRNARIPAPSQRSRCTTPRVVRRAAAAQTRSPAELSFDRYVPLSHPPRAFISAPSPYTLDTRPSAAALDEIPCGSMVNTTTQTLGGGIQTQSRSSIAFPQTRCIAVG